MTDSQSTALGRCLLLELPPELRLIIYSYLDEVTTFTLKHVVVQDKVFLFRLKDVTDTLIIQSICRTIRDESLSLLHPAARYALTIDDNAYKATKVKGERKRQTAYEQLDLLSNSTHFAQVRELVVDIRSSGRSGKVMSDWLVTAVHEVMRRIEKAEKLERLKIIIPFGTRGTVYSTLCRAVVEMRYDGKLTLERSEDGIHMQSYSMKDCKKHASMRWL
nr:hypothetical protein B0A51_04352 [Rachicladosporium sp. CCFEE 5018]